MKKRLAAAIGVFLGMLALILDGETAVSGAREGIRLCTETVIPSLFPFFVLSIWITGNLYGSPIKVLKPLGRLCGIPEGAESVLLVGFLGGYPVGAQAAASLWRCGVMKKKSAQRMLGFCSNAGPGFLFGMAASLFFKGWMAWCLWGIHIASAIGVAVMLPFSPSDNVQIPKKESVKMAEALHQAVRVMASVCGWLIMFRILIAFGDRWFFWMYPSSLRAVIVGILELSNGCCALADVGSESMRFILCSGILAFGGCCVTMQTISVTSGLSMKYYLIGKGLQTILSVFLAWSVMNGSWPQCFAVLAAILFLLHKNKISSRILNPVGV